MKPICFIISIFFILITTYAHSTHGGPVLDRENNIKAAYLYNLLKFIEWPNQKIENNEHIEVCSFENVAINKHLNTLTKRTAKGKLISIRLLATNHPIPSSCFLLFITEKHQQLDNINYLNNKPLASVLTVGENIQFLSYRGHIALVNEDDRVRLKININRIKQWQFKVSAKLLEIAQILSL